MKLPAFLCCVYCGAPAVRSTCRAHRDLPKLDRPYTPRGIIYSPSELRRHTRRGRR